MPAPIKQNEFEAYAAIIRSGQMPDVDVPRFMEENPEFKRWYFNGRAEPATSPKQSTLKL
jgi:hypothetical protein